MEIRRIHEDEGDAVGALWDRMCREAEHGGPLDAPARRNLSRMLAVSAWHRDAFCLVAVEEGRIVGFVNGRTDAGDGLLPGILGEIDALYVVPGQRARGAERALAEAAVGLLRDRGAATVRFLSPVGDRAEQRFWRELGFEPDLVCLSRHL
ncbi:GNAT family N-acetyltransferase [Streptomyces huiliensis]|uniref:GNAT family N-acetyltransferase n=1 Tax=Streptomyces huiliensis TaxID=2876027 RepID=UPI001CBBA661|nr:GNAT family N-acetyltransferase [Streptomyces huiliensis]MBZ4321596.1 GNAT family N-acetyltransferase [Streptomyces huiliensis]